MPQLDIISFFNQIFWLFFFFVLFYIFFLKNIVPFVLRIFKTRSIKLVKSSMYTNTLLSTDLPKAIKVTETIFSKSISEIMFIFLSFNNKVDSWVNSEVLVIQSKSAQANIGFLRSIKAVTVNSYLLSNLIKAVSIKSTKKVTKKLIILRRWLSGL